MEWNNTFYIGHSPAGLATDVSAPSFADQSRATLSDKQVHRTQPNLHHNRTFDMERNWWTAQMTRVIFDCIEAEKGNNSLFIRDKSAGLEHIRVQLKDVTDPQICQTLTKAKIQNKLSKQSCNGGVKESNIKELFLHGRSVLRLWDMQGNVFTKEEIKASRQKHEGQQQPSQKRKASDDQLGSPPNRPRRGAPVTAATILSQPANKKRTLPTESAPVHSKRPKLTQGSNRQKIQTSSSYTTNDAGNDRSSNANTSRDESGDSSSEVDGSQQSEDDRSPEPSPSPLPRTTSNNRHGPRPRPSEIIFVCEHCDEHFTGKASLLNHKTEHVESKPERVTLICDAEDCNAFFRSDEDLQRHLEIHQELDELCTEASATESEEDSERQHESWKDHSNEQTAAPGEIDIIKLMRYKGCNNHEDVEHIKEEMDDIQRNIFDATLNFLQDSGIDARTPVTLNVESYEQPLVDLLTTIFGVGKIVLPAAFEERLRQPDNELQLFEFVTAIIGCATTDWALRPAPQGPMNQGVLKEVSDYLKSKSESLQDNVMEIAVRSYLQKHVKPRVGQVAHSMAAEVFHLLRHFLPSTPSTSRQHWPMQHLHSTPTAPQLIPDSDDDNSPPFSPLTQTSPHAHPHAVSGWPRRHQKDPQQQFLDALTDSVFQPALNLRLGMEMKGNGQYRFYIPSCDSIFASKEHLAHEKANNMDIKKPHGDPTTARRDESTSDRRIIVCLMPTVYGRFRESGYRDDPWQEEEMVISKAHVHLYNSPRKETLPASRRGQSSEDSRSATDWVDMLKGR
ncbi:hypothetical protein PMZ80_004978 [Knufia obscura]|uniref:C2H2-type domain-containing protein n=1 Tax=Knufia obscura TaxID=1635080 RepID=A0ABR0RQU0_9EURO|nr:hypothetical protein PMZ80_004978 [Knufia obscura]